MTEQEEKEVQEQLAAAGQFIIKSEQEAKDFKSGGQSYKEAADTYRAINDKTIEKVADSLKERPAAYIPESELRKIGNIRLQAPNLSGQAKSFATEVATYLGPAVQEAVDKYLENKKFKVAHEHYHTTMGQLWQYAEEASRKKIKSLLIILAILVVGLTIAGFAYFDSWVYWGYRLENVCKDTRQTKESFKNITDIFDRVKQGFEQGEESKERIKGIIRKEEDRLNGLSK